MAEELSEQLNREIVEEELEMDRTKWKHRRRLAYMSLVFVILVTLAVLCAVFFGDATIAIRLGQVVMFLSTMVIGFLSIVGAYMGLATLTDVKLGKK